jgi:hypothetical protein
LDLATEVALGCSVARRKESLPYECLQPSACPFNPAWKGGFRKHHQRFRFCIVPLDPNTKM